MMEEQKKRTAKRWRADEQQMLDAIVSRYGKNNVVAINRVPMDMWPPERTIGASCYQLTQHGWRTSGLPAEARTQLPADWFAANTGMPELFAGPEPRVRKPKETTTVKWLWGMYTKTVTK